MRGPGTASNSLVQEVDEELRMRWLLAESGEGADFKSHAIMFYREKLKEFSSAILELERQVRDNEHLASLEGDIKEAIDHLWTMVESSEDKEWYECPSCSYPATGHTCRNCKTIVAEPENEYNYDPSYLFDEEYRREVDAGNASKDSPHHGSNS